jgi:hypothetical protein
LESGDGGWDNDGARLGREGSGKGREGSGKGNPLSLRMSAAVNSPRERERRIGKREPGTLSGVGAPRLLANAR